MYQNNNDELEKIVKKLRTIEKWEEDYALYKECEKVFYNYNRNKSIELIQKIIQKYASQINTWGILCDNVKICYITYDDKSDKYIMDMLAYLGHKRIRRKANREGFIANYKRRVYFLIFQNQHSIYV